MANNEDYIENHYRANIGESLGLYLQNIVAGPFQFKIGIYKMPHQLALATNGISDLKLTAPDKGQVYSSELIMYAPLDWDIDAMMSADPDWAWPVDWIRRIALWHAERRFWFGKG